MYDYNACLHLAAAVLYDTQLTLYSDSPTTKITKANAKLFLNSPRFARFSDALGVPAEIMRDQIQANIENGTHKKVNMREVF